MCSRHCTYVLIFSLLLSAIVYGEDNNAPTPPILLPQGPNIYTFPVYGDVPVDYYTGAMHFSIPIHVIEVDGCKVPISLEYVGGGIKVAQDASNVGLGWYLCCGGNITLDCYGQDDFEYNGGYLNTIFPEGIPSDSNLYRYRKNNDASYDITIWDTRPDVYSYSFAGYSGKMMFARDNKHVPRQLNPKAYLDIYYEHDAHYWRVYDAQGNKYCFGNKYHVSGNGLSGHYTETGEGGTTYQDMDDPSALNPDWTYQAINAWPIDTIITNQGHQILFSYHSEYSRTPVIAKEEIRLVPHRINESILFSSCQICQSGSTISFHTTEIKQAVIDQISYPGGHIQFYSSERADIWEGRGTGDTEPSKLDSIIVRSGTKIIKKVHFHYHYMGDISSPNTCRLILDSVSGITPRPYVFTYYSEFLPKKNSRQIDMWGFYNNSQGVPVWGTHGGAPTNEGTLVPSMELGGKFYYGRNRKVDSTVITNAMLQSVIYPTGGKTTFTYEPNKTIPTSTDAECIESNVVSGNLSLIHNVNYITTPATISLSSLSQVLTFYLDSTSVLDANISTWALWAGSQQQSVISYLVLRDSTGNEIVRKTLYLYPAKFETDWHFKLNGLYPSGTYTLTLEDAQNTSIYMLPPSVPTNSGTIYTIATVTHSKHHRLGNDIEEAAGVRIASIMHYDKNDSLVCRKDYSYIMEDSTSSGALMVHPTYHKIFAEEFLPVYQPEISGSHWCYPALGYIVTSDMIVSSMPMAYSTPIGYSRVIESLHPDSVYGKTVYIYNNHLGNEMVAWPGFTCVGNEINGELLQKKIYAANDRLIEKNQYLSNKKSSFIINGLHYFHVFPARYYTADNQHVDNIMLEKYTFRHTQNSATKTIRTTYTENGDSIVEISHIVLDSCLLLPKTTTTRVNQDSTTVSYIYAFNDVSSVGQSLKDYHNPGALLNAVKSENGHVQDSAFYQYDILNNHSVLTKEYHLKADGEHDTICTYKALSFDSNNNPITITNSSEIPVAYLWGCERHLPIVQAIGITGEQLQSSMNPGFLSMLQSSCDVFYLMLKSVYSAITTAFPYAEVTVRSYFPGVGVSCEINPQGVVFLYDYDEYGRLSSVSKEINGQIKLVEQYEYHLSGE